MSRAHDIWADLNHVPHMKLEECRAYINRSVPWLLDERQRLGNESGLFRAELERIAASEPAHRARITDLLKGGTS